MFKYGRFSVLMSIYKNTHLDHFIECLNSLANQTLKPSEIIIVQDGPLDFNLNDLLVNYSKFNFLIKKNNTNLGLAKSLNIGLIECSYDLIFRMDADDICHPERFSAQYNIMMNNQNIIVLGSNVDLIDSHSYILPNNRQVPLSDSNIRKSIYFKNPFNHPSVVYRKSILKKVCYYDDVPLYEDWYLWVKLAKLEGFYFLNIKESLLKYRIRDLAERRGFNIYKKELFFYIKLLNNGYINLFTFIVNVISKFIIRMIPSSIYVQIKDRADNFFGK